MAGNAFGQAVFGASLPVEHLIRLMPNHLRRDVHFRGDPGQMSAQMAAMSFSQSATSQEVLQKN